MSLEEHIKSIEETIDRLILVLENSQMSYSATGSTVEEKPKRNRRTKAQMKGSKEPVPTIEDPDPLDLGVEKSTDVDPFAGTNISLKPGATPPEHNTSKGIPGDDSLLSLDTPAAETVEVPVEEITEEKLRLAAKGLVDVMSTEGLAIAKQLILKTGVKSLNEVTPENYAPLYKAFKLAVSTWKK